MSDNNFSVLPDNYELNVDMTEDGIVTELWVHPEQRTPYTTEFRYRDIIAFLVNEHSTGSDLTNEGEAELEALRDSLENVIDAIDLVLDYGPGNSPEEGSGSSGAPLSESERQRYITHAMNSAFNAAYESRFRQ